MAYGRYAGTPNVCPAWRPAHSGKTDSGYRREQCILKKNEDKIHSQNMSTFIKSMPQHSPADRQHVITMACIIRPKAQM